MAIKLQENQSHNDVIKRMADMEPLEVCVVVEPDSTYHGSVVVRTAARGHFEVMNLSIPGIEECWRHPKKGGGLSVRELREGETYTLILSK